MKRIALAAALMAAFAGSAMAQSSVTLYGRVNTSLEFQDNGDDDKSVMENNASRWGLRGSEDLGGGLSAFFQLEAGFGSDTGSGSGGFSRDAYVGLKSKSLGSIQAGKFFGELYYGTIDWIGMFNHNTGTTAEDNFYPLAVVNTNSVQYISPVIGGGFKVSALVSAGEGTGTKIYEGAVQWDSGPFHVGAGYQEAEDRFGVKNTGYSIGGSYNWGNFTFGLNYAYGDNDVRGDRDHVQGTAMYALNQHEFHFSAGYTSSDDPVVGVGSGSASQWTLGYNYNLSKRTKLYAFYFSQDNGNATYISRSLTAIPNETWSSFGAGIRHNF